MKWTLISDDLSGACETGSAINQELNLTSAALRSFASVDLFSQGRIPTFGAISFIDLNIRDCAPENALSIFSDFLNILEKNNPDSINFYKVDSLLRGNLAMQAKVLAAKNPLIFIPAVPALDRLVKNGEVNIHDTPLRQTSLWKDEKSASPGKIGELFTDLKVSYSEFQSIEAIKNLLTAMSPGEILIPDIGSIQDLVAIAELLTQFPAVIPMGSAQFALAHFSAHRGDNAVLSEDLATYPIQAATVIVGSDSEVSLAQLAYLQSTSHNGLSADDIVVKVSQGDDLQQFHSSDFATRAIFISGGTTARRFLDSAGVTRLRMLNSIGYGVALGVGDNGQLIGIKPGSFGKEDTISNSLSAMLAISTLPNRN